MTEPVAASAGLRASIVIPVFNNLALTKDCLKSVFACTPQGTYEIIVVDNGSSDGTWDYLQSLQPQIRGLRNPRNMFFARGCNRGAWAAKAETVVFLNNDTIVQPGWLEELLRPLDRDRTTGVTGNKQLFPDSRVWHAGTVIGSDRLPWHICYGFERTHPAVNRERDCITVSGCCMAIRRDVFKQLRGFDPHFENGFEDADLCLRVRALGYRIVYAPRSEIIHLVSRSEGRFDREDANREKFKARWGAKLVPDEREFLRDSGFLPERTLSPRERVADSQQAGGRVRDAAAQNPIPPSGPPVRWLSGHLLPEGEGHARVGFISPFNQSDALSRRAEQLLKSYPADSYVVLAEFGTADAGINVIPCWERSGQWFYPLLRWATTLDLDVIHVNFDSSVFPPTFLELIQALKDSGMRLVVTMHRLEQRTPLLDGIAQLADAIIVDTDNHRLHLIRAGFPPSRIHVLSAADAEGCFSVYRELTSVSEQSLPRVRWEGPQLVNHSLALVNREMELALMKAGKVELTIAPTCSDTFAGSLHSQVKRLPVHYGCSLTGPADVHVRHQWPPNWNPPQEGRWVVIQPWEYGALPEEWVRPINRDVDEVWAPSSFVRSLYLESGVDADRVHVIPNGVDTDFFRPGAARYPLKSAKGFRFLFLGGTIHRKGIDLLLEAYCRAFTPSDDVSLVIKDMGATGIYRGQGMGDRIRELQARSDTPHIVYLEHDLADEQMVALYNACDCLVHPYRGEGFALPVLEAMACALPAIVTAGGATDDFVDDATGYRVPAQKRVFGDRCISGLRTTGDLWFLEPDVDALTNALSNVFQNREAAREMGERARAKVEAGWTWKHAADKATARIQALVKAPVRRHQLHADGAVLIDGVRFEDLDSIIESLQRHTYASIAAFIRLPSVSSGIREKYPHIEFLSDLDFALVLQHVRTRVRTSCLAVITDPIRFSKHWLSQLAAILQATGEAATMVVPSMIDRSSDLEDREFQKLARAQWRDRRGVFRPFAGDSSGCAVVSWKCLSLELDTLPYDGRDWLSRLRRNGVPSYTAEDTCIGSAQAERVMHTQ